MNSEVKEYREIKELIIKDFKEHSNIISKIYFDSDLMDKITNAIISIKECFKNQGKLILIGNGGSCSQAEHISAEFVGIGLPAISLTSNTSIITALGNDFGFDNIFSKQLESIANENDILIILSTSGNSVNCLKIIDVARIKNIKKIIIITGKTGGKIRYILTKKDILINIPSDETVRIQEITITIGHIIFESIRMINKI